jgi:hypothetical protein
MPIIHINIKNNDCTCQIRNCEIAELHDLDTSVDYVRDKQVDWLNKLIAHGVVGFR